MCSHRGEAWCGRFSRLSMLGACVGADSSRFPASLLETLAVKTWETPSGVQTKPRILGLRASHVETLVALTIIYMIIWIEREHIDSLTLPSTQGSWKSRYVLSTPPSSFPSIPSRQPTQSYFPSNSTPRTSIQRRKSKKLYPQQRATMQVSFATPSSSRVSLKTQTRVGRHPGPRRRPSFRPDPGGPFG